MKKTKFVIFSSGRGTTYQEIVRNCEANSLNAQVVGAIVSQNDCGAVYVSRSYNIPCRDFDFSQADVTQKVLHQLYLWRPDFIVCAGFLKKIPIEIINAYKNRIINTHPSLLPKYGGKGMYGKYVHQAVFDKNESVTGVTIHFVSEEYDEGPIIAQKKVRVGHAKCWQDVERTVKQQEKPLLIQTLKKLVSFNQTFV